jgi:4-amino-4-deoxy-L-arabinose transferase-like glycosyltransferase
VKHLTLPGVQYDEALHAPAAIVLLKGQVDVYGEQALTIAGRSFPVMHMVYLGSLKSYLLAPAFYLFGINVQALRLATIFVTVMGLVFTARFAKAVFGPRTALWTTWLIATDPSLILYSRCDWGPIAIAFALRMSSLFYLWRWWNSGGQLAPLIAASALLGLGVYDKTNFLWFVVAIGVVGLVLWQMSEKRPRVTMRNAALALGCGFVASAPLWVLNVSRDWITFRSAFVPGTKLGELLPGRIAALKAMLNGQATDAWMFGQPLPPHYGGSGTLLLPLSAAAMIVLLLAGITSRRLRLLAIPALITVILIEIILTPRPVWVHHWITVYPFPHLAVGLMLAEAWSGLRIRPSWQMGAACIGWLVILTAVSFNLLTMTGYHRLMRDTGGAGQWHWSDAIYSLADGLQSRYANRPIVLMDWGFANQLFLLSAGRLKLREAFWPYVNSSEPREELIRLVADPANVFVAHTPTNAQFPKALVALGEAARKACATPMVERHYFDRRGNPVSTLIEFSSGRCPQTRGSATQPLVDHC